MRHLLISREYPPAPGGGIGTYILHMASALAAAGETVHVIGQRWTGADLQREELYGGRLVIHRLPFNGPDALFGTRPHRDLRSNVARGLFGSSAPARAFAWQVAELVEHLVQHEGIDVVEAPDYEAPLEIFQLRRALGLGPKRQPPCVIHLHSPTEFIARANGWDPACALGHTSERLETYSILTADALLCPSRFLARQIERRYALEAGPIEVIPYPAGAAERIERTPATWSEGSVLYLGRLELRKGILEWIEAAADVAREHPGVRFEFVGADYIDAQMGGPPGQIHSRIPAELRSQFKFHDHRDRGSLRELLARARLVAVPSRWENFPYTCVEAMASGVPVIASPEGGMAEMIDNGRSGWIAASARPVDLASATLAALASGPTGLERAGGEAAIAIRRLCDDRIVVARHLEFVDRLVRTGAKVSVELSSHLPRRGRPVDQIRATQCQPSTPPAHELGIACAIIDSGDASDVQATRRTVEAQTQAPVAFAVLATIPKDATARNRWLQLIGVLPDASTSAPVTRPVGVVFLHAGVRIAPDFLERSGDVLRRHPQVGIVTCWHSRDDETGALVAPPCPAFPYQWLWNDVAEFAVLRGETIRAAGGYRDDLDSEWAQWDLANAAMASGWKSLSYPAVLAYLPTRPAARARVSGNPAAAMNRRLLERFPDEVAHDAIEMLLLAGNPRSDHRTSAPPGVSSLGDAIRVGMRQPLRSSGQLARRLARRLFPQASR